MPNNLPENNALDFYPALNEDDPRALINIVPSAVASKLLAIPKELFELDLNELRERCIQKGERKNVSFEELDMLRVAWWCEYTRAQKTATKFVLSNVYQGVCFQVKFLKNYIGNSFRLLYLITPPVDFQVQQQYIMQKSFEFEKRILEMPEYKAVYSSDGDMIGEEADTKLLAIKQKISEAVKNRVQGMPVNRSMQINQNLNTHTINTSGVNSTPITPDLDEAELRQIVGDLKGEMGLIDEPEMKDVNVNELKKD